MPPGRSKAGIILFILILGLIAGAVFFFRPKPQIRPEVTPTPTPDALIQQKTWTDPAGFSLQYPEGIVINPHEEDNLNYAHLELMHPDHTGSLIVWVKDTSSADVNAWVKTEKAFSGGNIIDSTLGGEPAKKVLLQEPLPKIFTGSIYDELLFMIEADLADREYWQNVHDGIVTSFTFIPLDGEQPAQAAAPDESYEEYAVDEEEVLE